MLLGMPVVWVPVVCMSCVHGLFMGSSWDVRGVSMNHP